MTEKEQRRLDFDREEEYRREYFLKIELLFSALRGRGLLLSPADYQLAYEWFNKGIPLSCVQRGIRDAYFKKLADSDDPDEEIRKLSWCSWAVKREWKEYKAVGKLAGPREDREDTSGKTREEAVALIDGLAFDITRASEIAAAEGNPALADALIPIVETLADLKREAKKQDNIDLLEERLRELDEKMMTSAEATIDERSRAKIEKSVERKLRSYRDSMPLESYETACRSAFRSKLRMNLALPLLTLYSF
jgi:hypothetical protein